MKLKKIASLMLAGIMAVSMLAACGEGKKDDSSSSSSEVTTITDAAAGINAELNAAKGTISFTGSDELANAVKTYFNNHPISGDYWKNRPSGEMADQATIIADMLGITADNVGADDVTDWLNEDDHNSKETGLVVYGFNQKYNNKDAVLKFIGQMVDELDYADDYAPAGGHVDNKRYSYSGNAEMVEIKSANGEVSLWVVAVQFTKDYVNR